MSMLNGMLQLHDPRCDGHCHPGCIQDVEAFCGALLERRQIRVGDGEYEDTLADLIAETWRRANQYNPSRDTGARSNMAASIRYELTRFFTDRHRANYRTIWKFKGYTYERKLPQFVLHTDARGELERTLRNGDMAAPEAGSTDLSRLLGSRSGVDPRRDDGLGTNGVGEAA